MNFRPRLQFQTANNGRRQNNVANGTKTNNEYFQDLIKVWNEIYEILKIS